MLYQFTVPTDKRDEAEAVRVGEECRVKYAMTQVQGVCRVLQTSVASGSPDGSEGERTADPTYVAPISANGFHMQVSLLKAVSSSVAIEVQFDVTYAGGTTGTATATFAPPAYVRDQTFNLPTGFSVDLVPDSGSLEINSITGLAGITGGEAGAVYAVRVLPAAADWIEIDCAMEKTPVWPVEKSITVGDRFDPAKYTKKVRGEQPMLTIGAAAKGYLQGLQRLNGQECTVMLEWWDSDETLVQREVYGHWRPTAQRTAPETGTMSESAAGNFAEFLVFQ